MIDFDIPEGILSTLDSKKDSSYHTIKQNRLQTAYEEKESFNSIKKESLIKSQNLKDFVKSKIIKDLNKCEVNQDLYPLFRNYPNGSDDYYLKLGSKKIEKQVKVLFIGNKIFNRKIYSFFKKNNCLDEKNYDFIITTNLEKAKKISSRAPIVLINCRPDGFIDKKRTFYFYDNLNLFKTVRHTLFGNKIKCMYRKNCIEVLEFLYKIKKEKNFD